jgi:hypothetical protein
MTAFDATEFEHCKVVDPKLDDKGLSEVSQNCPRALREDLRVHCVYTDQANSYTSVLCVCRVCV